LEFQVALVREVIRISVYRRHYEPVPDIAEPS